MVKQVHKKKSARRIHFSRKIIVVFLVILACLSASIAYAAYDISQGGWLSSYFGEAIGINKISSKEVKAQKAADTQAKQDERDLSAKELKAKKEAEKQAKQDARDKIKADKKSPLPVICAWCGMPGHKIRTVTNSCDASGKQYTYKVDDTCHGCYISGTSAYQACTP